MAQSAINSLSIPDYSFANLARFGPKATMRVDAEAGKAFAKSSELSQEEAQQIQRLKQTDREVRAHEQAHLAVGADLVRGGPSYTYQIGPDDKRYAIGGDVTIDTSPGRTPQETIPKAQHIRETALAPADPSPQDYRVAAHASQMESSARIEAAALERENAVKENTAGEANPASNADSEGARLYLRVGSGGEDSTSSASNGDVFA